MAISLDAIRKFFTSPYVLHLEREVEILRGQQQMLLLQLAEYVKKPAPVAEPARREPPKFMPVRTTWEQYRDQEIARQEKEELDGIPSSGR